MSPRRLPTALLAYKNAEFMDSKPARVLRMMAEYFDPLVRLRKQGVHDTIVIFGSARIDPREQALRKLRRATEARGEKDKPMRVRAARHALAMSRYYEEARELGKRITEWSMTFGEMPRRFVVCSGGGPGIMEAANRGAKEAGGKSVGLGIQLPSEQFPNPYISPELNFHFHYFFMRKLWFAQLAKALVVFPGGFGTMDELWEMLTLVQTGKMTRKNLILIYGRKYWNSVINWRTMVRVGTISQSDYDLLQFADSVDEAFEKVRTQMERYHMGLDGDWRP
ncbi:MAG: TIGR00730 family Rossman fold protein [Candidatus Acidiferrales bacterium]